MAKYRKKPVVVEAIQWFKNGDHPEDFAEGREGFDEGVWRSFSVEEIKANGWEGGIVRYFRHPLNPLISGEKSCEHCGKKMHVHGWIDTLEGGHKVCPGDYIIKGVEGELYPCKPEIFAKTYEAVEETKPDTEKALCLHMSTMTEYAPKRTTCLDCGEEAPL